MVKIGTREELHKKLEKIWKKIYGKDDCPFCDIVWQKEHILWKGNFWYILHNLYSYSWNDKHIMAVPYEHKIYSTDLMIQEIQELEIVYKKVKEFFWEENYFSFTRETMANRSVEHFHIHFLVWKLQGKYLRKMLQNQGFPIVENLDLKK